MLLHKRLFLQKKRLLQPTCFAQCGVKGSMLLELSPAITTFCAVQSVVSVVDTVHRRTGEYEHPKSIS